MYRWVPLHDVTGVKWLKQHNNYNVYLRGSSKKRKLASPHFFWGDAGFRELENENWQGWVFRATRKTEWSLVLFFTSVGNFWVFHFSCIFGQLWPRITHAFLFHQKRSFLGPCLLLWRTTSPSFVFPIFERFSIFIKNTKNQRAKVIHFPERYFFCLRFRICSIQQFSNNLAGGCYHSLVGITGRKNVTWTSSPCWCDLAKTSSVQLLGVLTDIWPKYILLYWF